MFHNGNEGAEKNECEGHFQRVKRNHWGRFVDQKNVLAYSQCIWGWAGGGGQCGSNLKRHTEGYGLTFKEDKQIAKIEGIIYFSPSSS